MRLTGMEMEEQVGRRRREGSRERFRYNNIIV